MKSLFLKLQLTCSLLSTAAFAGQAIVVDGDTLEIAGTKYRLHGIDTPEAEALKAGWRAPYWSN